MTQIFVAPTTCPNCGRDLEGAYCAACGQKVAPLNPTFHDLMHDIVHEFLHVDGKIFHSVRLLLTRPGFLSYEYFNGRRARYVSPLRLYLIFSVVFFGMTAITSKPLTAEDRSWKRWADRWARWPKRTSRTISRPGCRGRCSCSYRCWRR